MVRYHGNWCGPTWTAGQIKEASELTDEDRKVPAIDQLDACCKEHDISIADANDVQDINKANDIFIEKASQLGIKGKVAATLVNLAGPGSTMPNLRGSVRGKDRYDMLAEDTRSKELQWKGVQDEDNRDTEIAVDIAGAFSEEPPSKKTKLRAPPGGRQGNTPVFAPDRTSGQLTTMDQSEAMEVEPMAARSAGTAASTGTNNTMSKETPISIPPTLTYGLQNTHTTILPWTGWVSTSYLSKDIGQKLSIRLNSIYDMFPTHRS